MSFQLLTYISDSMSPHKYIANYRSFKHGTLFRLGRGVHSCTGLLPAGL